MMMGVGFMGQPHTHIYGAASPRRRPPPPWYAPPPPPALNKQAHVIHVTVDVPHGITVCPRPPTTPLALETAGCGSDNPQHMEHTQGTTGAGWGRITHNTGNHRAPCPSPPLRHTDEDDGDDVVRNDADVLFPVWLLAVPLLLCCSGLRHRMFIALFS